MKILIVPHWVRATLARYGRTKEAMLDRSFMSEVFSRNDLESLRDLQREAGPVLEGAINLKLPPTLFLPADYLPPSDERDFYEEATADESRNISLLLGRTLAPNHFMQFYASDFPEVAGESVIAVDVCVEKIDTRSKLIGDKQFVESLICKLYENQCSMVDLVESGLIANYTKRLL